MLTVNLVKRSLKPSSTPSAMKDSWEMVWCYMMVCVNNVEPPVTYCLPSLIVTGGEGSLGFIDKGGILGEMKIVFTHESLGLRNCCLWEEA